MQHPLLLADNVVGGLIEFEAGNALQLTNGNDITVRNSSFFLSFFLSLIWVVSASLATAYGLCCCA
jgi:hypothetical protein